MKLLLDENVSHRLRPLLAPQHEAVTVKHLKWDSVRNGRLLQRAADAGFDALITHDRGFEFEQNLLDLPVAVIVVRSKTYKLEDVKPRLPQLRTKLHLLKPRTLVHVG